MATTTLKAKMLSYRDVGATSTSYTNVAGVLKGLTITQDEPESTSIDAEFSDSPFYIEYTGNPVTINFELANYTLSELADLFQGTVSGNTYEAPTQITSTEKQWKLDFGVGFASLVIYKGQLVGTLKKDEDGALNYACTITSLMETYTSGGVEKYRTYAIIGPDQSSSGGGSTRAYGGAISGITSGSIPNTFTSSGATVVVSFNDWVSTSVASADCSVGDIIGNVIVEGNSRDLIVSAKTTTSTPKITLKDNVLNPDIQVELTVDNGDFIGTIKSIRSNISSSNSVTLTYIKINEF